MFEFKCDKCDKEFKLKTDLQRHLNRKNPCDIVNPNNECEYCQKSYSSRSNLNKHIKACKEKQTSITTNQTGKNHKTQIISGDNSSINNTEIKHLTINIVPFLGEDMSMLTDKKKLGILKKCYMSIPELIKQINFNPDVPEHHNVYISNIKSKYGHINDGKDWILTKVDELIDDLINKKKDDIEELLEEFKEDLPQKVISKIRDVIASIEYDPLSDEEPSKTSKEKLKFRKLMLDEVKLLLYNGKSIPQATRSKNDAIMKEQKNKQTNK
jgi:hypothetical protein